MLDRLRASFIYVVALVLPLAGVVIAVVRYSEGDREEAIRLAALALLGLCVLLIVLT